MIPSFPRFKRIRLADKKEIQAFTQALPCYSDFNFTSMLCWDTKNRIRVSRLNGNLIVQFTDYVTNEKFHSFLGVNKVNETAAELLKLSAKNGLTPRLKLVPDITATSIDQNSYFVTEDPDNADYIYNLDRFETYSGPELHSRRSDLNRFMSAYPSVETRILNLNKRATKRKVINLTKKWERNKISGQKDVDLANELKAIKRLLSVAKSLEIIAFGAYSGDELIGFCISELLPNGYALSHFAKADTSYKAIYAYLMHREANVLHGFGRNALNYEQDLGIESLRKSKQSYDPVMFLKKFTIKPRE